MNQESDSSQSKPPPGGQSSPRAASHPADEHAQAGSPIAKGGLPGTWGRRLPLLMLAAGVIAVVALIATSSNEPKRVGSDSFSNQTPDNGGRQSSPTTQPPAGASQVQPPAQGSTSSFGTTGPTGGGETSSPEVGDAQTKALVVTGAQAFETCATDNNGSYIRCDLRKLEAIEPALAEQAQAMSLTVSSGNTSYAVSATSPASANTFTLQRDEAGRVQRSCVKAGEAGCTTAGTW